MKNIMILLLVSLFIQNADAATFYDQLCVFNENWKKYSFEAPQGEARVFNTDQKYVEAHLSSVILILQNNPTMHLSKAQLISRIHLIEVLQGYLLSGDFPVNYHYQKRIPVFIDEQDTHCAVGFLLKESGYGATANEIAATNNYAWIKDIQHPELSKWQKSSGFSIEELKLIQGAYEFYMPNALILANRFEIPQKPEVMTLYFDGKSKKNKKTLNQENIWCHGVGENGVLNGPWIQNFAVGIRWIEGFFENGNRTGQWKEYYQGTNQLCRTENWRNDKLNGVRRRFDRSGKLIEEILFKDGIAMTKINYDFTDSLKWIRQPVSSDLMNTEVYTFGGALIAHGQEKVHNPGNLLWFQNIELTALNSAAITSRDIATSTEAFSGNNIGFRNSVNLYSSPPLVEYKKEGKWIYYKEPSIESLNQNNSYQMKDRLRNDYLHFGESIFQSVSMFNYLNVETSYDSIQVKYDNDDLQHFQAYGKESYIHLSINYHNENSLLDLRVVNIPNHNGSRYSNYIPKRRIRTYGQYNEANQKIGLWRHFDELNRLYKIEDFIIPWKEEEEILYLENIPSFGSN